MGMESHDREGTRGESGRFRTEAPIRVGNDVVDLRHPSCQDRAAGDPFAHRILSPPELAWLEQAADPGGWNLRLWASWAAKETAFKALEKGLRPSKVFRPRTLVCELFEQDPGDVALLGSPIVRFRGLVRGGSEEGPVAVEGASDGSWLHMVGWSGGEARPSGWRLDAGVEGVRPRPEPEVLDGFRHRFSEEEWEGIHSVASARARILARDRVSSALSAYPSLGAEPAGRSLGSPRPAHPGVEILTSGDRPGRTPPRLRIGGIDRPDLDLSLSHHGRFVAWAILLPPAPQAPGVGGW